MRFLVPIALAVLALAGCAAISPPACPAGTQEMWQAKLLFGRNIGGAMGVSESDWQSFVANEIESRFPTGFTVIDATGEWRGANGSPAREASKIVLVVAPAGSDTRGRLDAIAAAYKLRFHQESVGLVVAPACASF